MGPSGARAGTPSQVPWVGSAEILAVTLSSVLILRTDSLLPREEWLAVTVLELKCRAARPLWATSPERWVADALRSFPSSDMSRERERIWSSDSSQCVGQKTISFLCMSYGVTGDLSKPPGSLPHLQGCVVCGISAFKAADGAEGSAEWQQQTLGGFFCHWVPKEFYMLT